MNLQKLFELQRKLDEHIEQQHPRQEGEDRLAKKILALQVELGELANEWRGFKFWSNDQEPRTEVKIPCRFCSGAGKGYFCGNEYTGQKEQCIYCHGTGVKKIQNRLLEEYVDCLHFILSIGLEIEFKRKPIDIIKSHDVITQFNEMFRLVSTFWRIYAETGVIKGCGLYDTYEDILRTYMGLGQELGFSWKQIEEAYCRKNAINHERQENGY
jgi:dimeric dUTPase (all-alpha-NTP-PPase superfamily)